ncbi:MAG TPA: DUF697 domain-containing protein [Stellaceae bacterium]|jgi:uncharacterized protein (DUF697 family)
MTRLEQANEIVRRYEKWAFVGGLVPLPALDVATVSGIQMKMLFDLSKVYELPFKSEWVKSAIGSLIGSVGAGAVTAGVVGSGIKSIPVIGTTIGVLTMPALSVATTIAVGRVFIQHFETGGNFLDFDPEKLREHYRAEFEGARGGRATV